MGSETFIIVALRCNENKVPSIFVASICSFKKTLSALADIKVASTTVPTGKEIPSFRTVVVPPSVTSSILTVPACSFVNVTEVSLDRKSPEAIVDTRVLLSADQTPIECGFAMA